MGDCGPLRKALLCIKAAKMLAIGGFSSLGEFLAPTKTKKRIRETTAAAEYYILKTALLFNPEKFIKIMHSPPDTQQISIRALSTHRYHIFMILCLHIGLTASFSDKPNAPRTTELFKTGRVTLQSLAPCLQSL